MDLLEYQAKELFRQVKIPVLPSQKINYPQELKALKIPYPIVLKSQVRAGGRAKAGGIKFAGNTIDAVAAAQAIFHLPIRGEYPEVVLAEAKYNAKREFYLAIVLDRCARRPMLLGSTQGGIDIDLTRSQMQHVLVCEQFSPFYARRLTQKMGLKGDEIEPVSSVIEKMYQLFLQNDLDLVEINPLGIRSNGEVMALDGKVSVNDSALDRHAMLVSGLRSQKKESYIPLPFDREIAEADGNLAIVCNGTGLTMATLDLVYLAGGKPANFLDLGPDLPTLSTALSLEDRLELGLARVSENPRVKVVLVNIISDVISRDRLTAAIGRYLDYKSREGRLPRLVLCGGNGEATQPPFDVDTVSVATTLEEAIDLSVKGRSGDLPVQTPQKR
ncbi:MAG: succinate--CoA ligase subunit beta [Geitlerinemataceae cyanobacterium]